MNLPEKIHGERLSEMTEERLLMVAHELSFTERERLGTEGDATVTHAEAFLRHDPLDVAGFVAALGAAKEASAEWHAAMREYARRHGG